MNATLLLTPPSPGWSCITACGSVNATPACVRNEAENARVTDLLRQHGTWGWLGLFQWPADGDSKTGWQWATTCQSKFRKWMPRNPNDAMGAQSCVKVRGLGDWDDMACAYYFPCICERPAVPINDTAVSSLAAVKEFETRWAQNRIHAYVGIAVPVSLLPTAALVFWLLRLRLKSWLSRKARRRDNLIQPTEIELQSTSASAQEDNVNRVEELATLFDLAVSAVMLATIPELNRPLSSTP
eukprot:743865-Prymnesium_polylepis.1